jgi:hypothetical protein
MNKKLLILISILSVLILLVKGFGYIKDYTSDRKFNKIAYTYNENTPDNKELYEQLDTLIKDAQKKQLIRDFQLQTEEFVKLVEGQLSRVEAMGEEGASAYLLESGKAKQFNAALKKLNQSAGSLVGDQNYQQLNPERYLTKGEAQQEDSWAQIMFASVPNSVVKVWLVRFKHDVRTEEKYLLEELKNMN